MASPTTEIRPSTRRFAVHLSLRGLILLILLVGGGLGWVVHRAREQREAVEVLRRAGCHTGYDPRYLDRVYLAGKPSGWLGWLANLVGIDYFADVSQVSDGLSRGPGISDDVMASVERLAHLESLNLDGGGVTDLGMVHLRGLSGLKNLRMIRSPGLTGACLARVAELPVLEYLEVSQPILTTDADLDQLSGMSRLRSLTLVLQAGSTVTDAGLAHLEPLTDLWVLNIQGADRITNSGLASLGKLASLDRLSLDSGRINDLKGLSPLIGLKILELKGLPIDDPGLAAVAGFRSMESFSLIGDRALTDAGMVSLRDLPRLRNLCLQDCPITDIGLASLGDLPRLATIDLSGTEVGDEGILSLVKLKGFTRIDVKRTRVTPEGIAAILAIQPGLQLLR